MNRWLIAMATGLFVAGCATGVEDPLPPPPPDPVQKDPPAQTFSTEIDEEQADPQEVQPFDTVGALPPRQKPPVPGLVPAPVQE